MNTRRALLSLALPPLFLLPVSSRSADEKPKADPPASKIRIRTADDFPDGIKELAVPLGRLDQLRRAAEALPDVDARFNRPGPQNIHRWEWLAAARRNIEAYDALCREATGCEAAFWAVLRVSTFKNKHLFESKAEDFQNFQSRRIEQRAEWYYTASSHHLRWEEESSRPVIYRMFISVCRGLGCQRSDLCRALAWIDLMMSESMPGLLYTFTIPFALMS
jgi:hypothetical protein